MQNTVLHQMKQYEDILGCFEKRKKNCFRDIRRRFFQFCEIPVVELGTCTMYTYSKYEYVHMYTVIDI